MSKVRNNKYQILFYTFSQLGIGVFNYIFQLLLMSKLNQIEYGTFLTWYSFINIFLIAATTAQTYSNFHILNLKQYRSLITGQVLLSFVLLFISQQFQSPTYLSAILIASSLLSGFIYGQMQARFLFVLLGAVTFIAVIMKFVLFYLYHEKSIGGFSDNIEIAVHVIVNSVLVANLFLIIGLFFSKTESEIKTGEKFKISHFYASVLLSAASVVFPQADYLAISGWADKTLVGAFAQLSTVFKIFYFAMMIAFQVLLPFQVQKKSLKLKRFLELKYLIFISILLIVFSFGFGEMLPFVWSQLTQKSFTLNTEIVSLGLFNTLLYCLMYFILQTLITENILLKSLGTFILVCIFPIFNAQWFHFEIATYFKICVFINFIIFIYSFELAKKHINEI